MSAPHPTLCLVVFADDWGRHPSSCQHLVRHLLPRHRVLWVNTIGTRRPGLTRADLARAAGKLRQWFAPGEAAAAVCPNLQVISPRMWPGFRTGWQRGLNDRLVAHAVHRALGTRPRASADGAPAPTQQRVVLTTLPITAGLVGRLDADRWVYYCVDDFSVWPGLDADVMRTMEAELVSKVDMAVAASETLATGLAAMGRPATLLTHGIDPEHWSRPGAGGTPGVTSAAPAFPGLPRPIILFWGVIDPRLDVAWCQTIAGVGGTLVLVGPAQAPDPRLTALPHVRMPGPSPYDALPALAQQADVLVMPYADLPVTRAMQPLKFKEYLATGKPVVVRRLPATGDWGDCADVVDTPEAFVEVTRQRAAGGVPATQLAARQRRLAGESWEAKARALEAVLLG